MGFALGQPLPLRPDNDAPLLRVLTRRSKDAAQARLGNVTLEVVRGWVLRCNAEGPDGLRDRKAPGATPQLTGSVPLSAGGCAISANGCGRSSASRFRSRR